MNGLNNEIRELASAEEFLEFFGIPYDEEVVRVNRLHILQRFHDYLARMPQAAEDRRTHMESLLRRAYHDFVGSDARTEKVFKVFRDQGPQIAFVPLADLSRRS